MKQQNIPILMDRFRLLLNSINRDIVLQEKLSEVGFNKKKINEILALYRELQTLIIQNKDSKVLNRDVVDEFIYKRQSVHLKFVEILMSAKNVFPQSLLEECLILNIDKFPQAFKQWSEVVREFYSFILHNCEALALMTEIGVTADHVLDQIFKIGDLEKLWKKKSGIIEKSYEQEIKLIQFKSFYNEIRSVVDKIVQEEPYLIKSIKNEVHV